MKNQSHFMIFFLRQFNNQIPFQIHYKPLLITKLLYLLNNLADEEMKFQAFNSYQMMKYNSQKALTKILNENQSDISYRLNLIIGSPEIIIPASNYSNPKLWFIRLGDTKITSNAKMLPLDKYDVQEDDKYNNINIHISHITLEVILI